MAHCAESCSLVCWSFVHSDKVRFMHSPDDHLHPHPMLLYGPLHMRT
jgi:hypothetical protein